MLLGVYLCIPFLKKISEDSRLENWFLILWGIFGLLMPVVSSIPQLELINTTFLGRMEITFPIGFVGYLLLGHKLSTIKPMSNVVLAISLLSSIIGIAFATYFISMITGSFSEVFYNYLNPIVAISACSVFLLAKNIKVRGGKLSCIAIKMSKYSLGIYMLHMIVYIVLRKFGVRYDTLNPIISIPMFSIVIYAISYACIYTIDKIPYIRKGLL